MATETQQLPTLSDLPAGEYDFEIVRGERRPVTPTSVPHMKIVGRLDRLVGGFVDKRGLGIFGPEAGFVLARDPLTVLAPDLAFIRADRAPPDDQTGFAELAPDLAIEVLSPSNSAEEMEERVALYLGAGVRQAWVVVPRIRAVRVHLPDGTSRILGLGDTIDGGDVLPGFSLPVAALFPRSPDHTIGRGCGSIGSERGRRDSSVVHRGGRRMAWPAITTQPDEIPEAPTDYEIVQGVRRPVTPVNFEHGRIAGRLDRSIGNFVDQHGLGDVGPERGFVLARDPLTVLAPDISFVRAERVPRRENQRGFVEMAPDLAVEVVSPRDTAREVAKRVALYLAAGVLLVWIVDPDRQTVTVHVPGATPRVLGADDVVDGGDVLPGFSLPVSAIFA